MKRETPTGQPAASVNRALEDYMHRCEIAPLRQYPLMWAGHYSGFCTIGEFATPTLPDVPRPIAAVGLHFMAPFGLSPEVEASFLVIDAFRAETFEPEPVLYVAGLRAIDRGILTTYWRCPVNVVRDIRTTCGPAEKAPCPVDGLESAMSLTVDNRMTATSSFEDAYQGSLHQMRERFG